MRFRKLLSILPFVLISVSSAMAQNSTTVRILLGVGTTLPTRWDGTVQVRGGNMVSLDPWRFEGSDGISGNTWHCSNHPVRLFN
jgi:hypothetical protein